jgi:hypothetical protein
MGMAGVDAGPPFNAEVTDNYVNIKDGTLTTSGLWRGVFDEQDAGKAIQVSIGRQPYCESGTKDILIRIQTGTKEVEVFGQKQEMPIYADFVINDVEVVDGMAIGEVTKLTINKSGQSSITTRWEKVDKFIAPNAQASSVVAEPAVEPEAEPEAEASEEPVPESEDEPSTETVEESAVEPEAEESAEEGAES